MTVRHDFLTKLWNCRQSITVVTAAVANAICNATELVKTGVPDCPYKIPEPPTFKGGKHPWVLSKEISKKEDIEPHTRVPWYQPTIRMCKVKLGQRELKTRRQSCLLISPLTTPTLRLKAWYTLFLLSLI